MEEEREIRILSKFTPEEARRELGRIQRAIIEQGGKLRCGDKEVIKQLNQIIFEERKNG